MQVHLLTSVCGGVLNDAVHPPMRTAGEFFLAAAGVNVAEAGEPVSRLGDGEQVVIDGAGDGVVLDQEAFFAALYVHGGGAVAEAEAGWTRRRCRLVDDVEDAADVDGPEAECVGFYGDDFALLDGCLRIGYANPAEIELQPLPEGCFRGCEGGFALADLRAAVVAGESAWAEDLFAAALGVEGDSVADAETLGAAESLCNFGLGWPVR